MNIIDLNKTFNNLEQKRDLIQEDIIVSNIKLDRIKTEYEHYSKARWVITEVQRLTQEKFQKKVEELVTLVVQSVFDRNFKFKLLFERKRNQLECRPVIMEGEDEYDPEYEKGGGLVDLISFAFRVVLWSLGNPKSRPIFILDEPMKNIGKGTLLQRAGQIFKEISHKLKFQLLIITHEPLLAEIADKTFEVSHNGIHSTVKEK